MKHWENQSRLTRGSKSKPESAKCHWDYHPNRTWMRNSMVLDKRMERRTNQNLLAWSERRDLWGRIRVCNENKGRKVFSSLPRVGKWRVIAHVRKWKFDFQLVGIFLFPNPIQSSYKMRWILSRENFHCVQNTESFIRIRSRPSHVLYNWRNFFFFVCLSNCIITYDLQSYTPSTLKNISLNWVPLHEY